MDQTEDKQLAIDSDKFKKLESLMQHPGWPIVQDTILDIYNEMIDKVVEIEGSPGKAQGAVWAMKELMTRIDQTNRLLAYANEQYIGKMQGKQEAVSNIS